jgi:predicted dehydrogenase
MVEAGALGEVRAIRVAYSQDWLATRLETTGNKQAAWRTDPAQAGTGCLGDIATHAVHLALFISGLQLEAVCADLASFVPGRPIDDHVQVLLRFAGGAKGMLWASQIAPGHRNDLEIGIYGTDASLRWRQESPERLLYSRLGHPTELIERKASGTLPIAAIASRIPAGHPEGYLEAMAQLYRDTAGLMLAHRSISSPNDGATWLPTVDDGLAVMRFVDAALRSASGGSTWAAVGPPVAARR